MTVKSTPKSIIQMNIKKTFVMTMIKFLSDMIQDFKYSTLTPVNNVTFEMVLR